MRVLFLLLALAGCATQKPPLWEKAGVTQAEFAADRSYCEFEVLKATQTVDTTYRTVLVQELDLNMRRRELAMSCMRMKGYTER